MGGYASVSAGNPNEVYFSGFIGNSKVTFNGWLAPILYASSSQINAVVPYEVAGQATVPIVVSHYLVAASAVTVPIKDTSPGIFTLTENGDGQGAVLNQDGSVNSAQIFWHR